MSASLRFSVFKLLFILRFSSTATVQSFFFPPLSSIQLSPLRRNRIISQGQTKRQALVPLFLSNQESSELFSRRNILTSLGALVLGLPFLVEAYSRLASWTIQPKDNILMEIPAQGWESLEELTLVFHGAGGTDANTDALHKVLQQQSKTSTRSSYSTILDWSYFSSNILQASFNGQVIGRDVANQIMAKAPSLQRVHVIGISVGAFACHAFIEQLKLTCPHVYLQETLLDPFCQQGIVDFGYGNQRFGVKADYSQQYLNTDDPVPSTNSPLKNCAVFNITPLRPIEVFGHDWPLLYYTKQGKVGFVDNKDKREKGSVTILDS